MKKKVDTLKVINIDDLNAYIKENDRFYEVDTLLRDGKGHELPADHVYDITINWGDWKHDHMFCDYLMEQKGYVRIAEVVTEEDGSDAYSSVHRYAFKEWWDRINRVKEFLNRNSKQ